MGRKWFLVAIIGTLLGVTLLSGCATGASQEDFAKLKAEVASLSANSAYLSAVTAYNIWYDQYYNFGTEKQYYVFTDTASFNKRIGDLVYATGDSASKAAWDTYLASDKALNDVLAELPKDYTTWTQEQTNKWSGASKARINALAQVGTALFNVVTAH